MRRLIPLIFTLWPTIAAPCDLALVLAVDVSGSVDREEYRIQTDGLAAALLDGIVTDALVDQEAHVTVIQWSGSTRQKQSIGWTAVKTPEDVFALSNQIANDPRQWRNFSTAVGEAVGLSIEAFAQVPHCRRKVIDVSGDGISNEGVSPLVYRAALSAQNITVNALAIETDAEGLTAWFFENLLHGEGAFVITAAGFEDYPDQIRRKLQRETTRQVSLALP